MGEAKQKEYHINHLVCSAQQEKKRKKDIQRFDASKLYYLQLINLWFAYLNFFRAINQYIAPTDSKSKILI